MAEKVYPALPDPKFQANLASRQDLGALRHDSPRATVHPPPLAPMGLQRLAEPLLAEETSYERASELQCILALIKCIVGNGAFILPSGITRLSESGTPPSEAVAFASALLMIVGLLNAWGFLIVGQACASSRTDSYARAWQRTLGPASFLPAVASLLVCFTTAVMCACVTADVSSFLLAAALRVGVADIPRSAVLGVATVGVFIPLCLLPSLAPLGECRLRMQRPHIVRATWPHAPSLARTPPTGSVTARAHCATACFAQAQSPAWAWPASSSRQVCARVPTRREARAPTGDFGPDPMRALWQVCWCGAGATGRTPPVVPSTRLIPPSPRMLPTRRPERLACLAWARCCFTSVRPPQSEPCGAMCTSPRPLLCVSCS